MNNTPEEQPAYFPIAIPLTLAGLEVVTLVGSLVELEPQVLLGQYCKHFIESITPIANIIAIHNNLESLKGHIAEGQSHTGIGFGSPLLTILEDLEKSPEILEEALRFIHENYNVSASLDEEPKESQGITLPNNMSTKDVVEKMLNEQFSTLPKDTTSEEKQ